MVGFFFDGHKKGFLARRDTLLKDSIENLQKFVGESDCCLLQNDGKR